MSKRRGSLNKLTKTLSNENGNIGENGTFDLEARQEEKRPSPNSSVKGGSLTGVSRRGSRQEEYINNENNLELEEDAPGSSPRQSGELRQSIEENKAASVRRSRGSVPSPQPQTQTPTVNEAQRVRVSQAPDNNDAESVSSIVVDVAKSVASPRIGSMVRDIRKRSIEAAQSLIRKRPRRKPSLRAIPPEETSDFPTTVKEAAPLRKIKTSETYFVPEDWNFEQAAPEPQSAPNPMNFMPSPGPMVPMTLPPLLIPIPGPPLYPPPANRNKRHNRIKPQRPMQEYQQNFLHVLPFVPYNPFNYCNNVDPQYQMWNLNNAMTHIPNHPLQGVPGPQATRHSLPLPCPPKFNQQSQGSGADQSRSCAEKKIYTTIIKMMLDQIRSNKCPQKMNCYETPGAQHPTPYQENKAVDVLDIKTQRGRKQSSNYADVDDTNIEITIPQDNNIKISQNIPLKPAKKSEGKIYTSSQPEYGTAMEGRACREEKEVKTLQFCISKNDKKKCSKPKVFCVNLDVQELQKMVVCQTGGERKVGDVASEVGKIVCTEKEDKCLQVCQCEKVCVASTQCEVQTETSLTCARQLAKTCDCRCVVEKRSKRGFKWPKRCNKHHRRCPEVEFCSELDCDYTDEAIESWKSWARNNKRCKQRPARDECVSIDDLVYQNKQIRAGTRSPGRIENGRRNICQSQNFVCYRPNRENTGTNCSSQQGGGTCPRLPYVSDSVRSLRDKHYGTHWKTDRCGKSDNQSSRIEGVMYKLKMLRDNIRSNRTRMGSVILPNKDTISRKKNAGFGCPYSPTSKYNSTTSNVRRQRMRQEVPRPDNFTPRIPSKLKNLTTRDPYNQPVLCNDKQSRSDQSTKKIARQMTYTMNTPEEVEQPGISRRQPCSDARRGISTSFPKDQHLSASRLVGRPIEIREQAENPRPIPCQTKSSNIKVHTVLDRQFSSNLTKKESSVRTPQTYDNNESHACSSPSDCTNSNDQVSEDMTKSPLGSATFSTPNSVNDICINSQYQSGSSCHIGWSYLYHHHRKAAMPFYTNEILSLDETYLSEVELSSVCGNEQSKEAQDVFSDSLSIRDDDTSKDYCSLQRGKDYYQKHDQQAISESDYLPCPGMSVSSNMQSDKTDIVCSDASSVKQEYTNKDHFLCSIDKKQTVLEVDHLPSSNYDVLPKFMFDLNSHSGNTTNIFQAQTEKEGTENSLNRKVIRVKNPKTHSEADQVLQNKTEKQHNVGILISEKTVTSEKLDSDLSSTQAVGSTPCKMDYIESSPYTTDLGLKIKPHSPKEKSPFPAGGDLPRINTEDLSNSDEKQQPKVHWSHRENRQNRSTTRVNRQANNISRQLLKFESLASLNKYTLHKGTKSFKDFLCSKKENATKNHEFSTYNPESGLPAPSVYTHDEQNVSKVSSEESDSHVTNINTALDDNKDETGTPQNDAGIIKETEIEKEDMILEENESYTYTPTKLSQSEKLSKQESSPSSHSPTRENQDLPKKENKRYGEEVKFPSLTDRGICIMPAAVMALEQGRLSPYSNPSCQNDDKRAVSFTTSTMHGNVSKAWKELTSKIKTGKKKQSFQLNKETTNSMHSENSLSSTISLSSWSQPSDIGSEDCGFPTSPRHGERVKDKQSNISKGVHHERRHGMRKPSDENVFVSTMSDVTLSLETDVVSDFMNTRESVTTANIETSKRARRIHSVKPETKDQPVSDLPAVTWDSNDILRHKQEKTGEKSQISNRKGIHTSTCNQQFEKCAVCPDEHETPTFSPHCKKSTDSDIKNSTHGSGKHACLEDKSTQEIPSIYREPANNSTVVHSEFQENPGSCPKSKTKQKELQHNSKPCDTENAHSSCKALPEDKKDVCTINLRKKDGECVYACRKNEECVDNTFCGANGTQTNIKSSLYGLCASAIVGLCASRASTKNCVSESQDECRGSGCCEKAICQCKKTTTETSTQCNCSAKKTTTVKECVVCSCNGTSDLTPCCNIGFPSTSRLGWYQKKSQEICDRLQQQKCSLIHMGTQMDKRLGTSFQCTCMENTETGTCIPTSCTCQIQRCKPRSLCTKQCEQKRNAFPTSSEKYCKLCSRLQTFLCNISSSRNQRPPSTPMRRARILTQSRQSRSAYSTIPCDYSPSTCSSSSFTCTCSSSCDTEESDMSNDSTDAYNWRGRTEDLFSCVNQNCTVTRNTIRLSSLCDRSRTLRHAV